MRVRNDAWASAWLVLAVGAMCSAASSLPCPAKCECVGDDLLWYYCGDYILKARDDGYVEINCQNTELNCSSLPTLEVGRDSPLQRLEVTQCSLPPGESVWCGGRGAKELALQQAEGGITADNVRGAELESIFMRFMPDAITSFPMSAVNSLPSLRRIRLLSGSSLPLSPRMFSSSPPLQYLEISMSGVQELPAAAFTGLKNLSTLSLWGNNIRNVSVEAFDGLESLQQLVLNSNPLRYLPPGVFAPTPALKRLFLDNIALTEIAEGVVSGLQHLQEIKLRSTVNLKVGEKAFSSLPSLVSFSLTLTNMSFLPEDVFIGTTSLVNLTLQGNGIDLLPEELFSGLVALQRLDLSGNRIASITREMFRNLRNLQEIDLSGNPIRQLPDRLFSGLTSLHRASLSECGLQSISPLSFVGAASLRFLSLSHNKLKWAEGDGENSSPLHMLQDLQELDLSHNNISCVLSDWRFVLRLRTLDLSYNNFTELAQSDVQFFGSTLENIPMRVDFRHNRIQTIHPRAFWDSPSPLARIQLDNNPFNCDCHLYSFLQEIQVKNQSKYDVSRATCHYPQNLQGQRLQTLKLEELTCPVPYYHSKTCNCLVRSAYNRVECDCTELNTLPDLNGSGLNNMSVRLHSLPPLLSLPEYVRELNLSGLQLQTLPQHIPQNLELLDLTQNQIKVVPQHLLYTNTSILLAGNPLECSCSTAEEVALLQQHLSRFSRSDYSLVTCEGRTLSSVDAEALCSEYRSAVAGVLFAVSLILIAVLIAILYIYRVEIQVVLYSRGWCLCLLPKEDIDYDKKYDVFVSFAFEDEEFVCKQILPKLETRYTLHVQDRDWEVGGTIPTQIHRSIESSKRTLIILSKNMMKSIWATEGFRTVHTQASSDKRKRAVVILLDVKKTELDKDVRSFLSLSTFIKYDERMFWDKLRYALPRKDMSDYSKVVEESPLGGKLPLHMWKGNGLNVVLNEEGKLINAGYVKE